MMMVLYCLTNNNLMKMRIAYKINLMFKIIWMMTKVYTKLKKTNKKLIKYQDIVGAPSNS